jgi:hypothetical protein
MHLVYTENQLSPTTSSLPLQDYRLRVRLLKCGTYELTALETLANGRYFQPGGTPCGAATESWAEIQRTSNCADRSTVCKSAWWNGCGCCILMKTCAAALPFGELNRLGLPYETYKIALDPEDLLQRHALGDKLPSACSKPDETRQRNAGFAF